MVATSGDDTAPDDAEQADHVGAAESSESSESSGSSGASGWSFSEAYARIVREVHPAGRGPYSDEEIARGVCGVGGPDYTAPYYYQLRTGRKTNPTWRLVAALARFFDVPLTAFAPESDRSADADAVVRRSRTIRHRPDLLAALDRLDPDTLAVVFSVVERLEVGNTDG